MWVHLSQVHVIVICRWPTRRLCGSSSLKYQLCFTLPPSPSPGRVLSLNCITDDCRAHAWVDQWQTMTGYWSFGCEKMQCLLLHSSVAPPWFHHLSISQFDLQGTFQLSCNGPTWTIPVFLKTVLLAQLYTVNSHLRNYLNSFAFDFEIILSKFYG